MGTAVRKFTTWGGGIVLANAHRRFIDAVEAVRPSPQAIPLEPGPRWNPPGNP
jgi:hypothetical protein